ncbi:MAG: DUF11 domain-containing protein [Cytophagales bacterium]|nr:MAG: DUF11 domain-containing protein [Cytophagales bacterium]
MRFFDRTIPRRYERFAVFLVVFAIWANASFAQISGTVFRDYNGNGTKGATAANTEPGVARILVNAYDATNALIASYTTTATGSYSMPATGTVFTGTAGSNTGFVPSGTNVRLEFVIPAGVCGVSNSVEYVSVAGSAFGSSVQFVSGGATNVNLALNNPADYTANTNPRLYSPCYISGDPLVGAASATGAIVGINYATTNNNATSANATYAAMALQVGATWGLALNRVNQKLYASAFVRRHVGLGLGAASGSQNATNAPGSIYAMNTSGAASGAFLFSLDAFAGFETHDHTAGATFNVRSNTARGLTGDPNDASYDPTAFGQVGKTGLGDLEISDDARYLFTTNLYQRSLTMIDLQSAASPVTPAVGQLKQWYLTTNGLTNGTPLVTCTGGVLRPWAVKFHRGKVYVGVVCTAENDGSVADNPTTSAQEASPNTNLGAYVFEFDPTGAGAWNTTPLLSIPLNYTKGHVDSGIGTFWQRWTDVFSEIPFYPLSVGIDGNVRPQPILADIEFDVDGSIIVGFNDRSGHQIGELQAGISAADPKRNYRIEIGGDILRAYPNASCTSFTLESRGDKDGAGPYTATSNQINNQGPGGGEFYWQESYGPDTHQETVTGGLALLPGAGQLTVPVMDPFGAYSGGIAWFNNNTGSRDKAVELISGGVAGNQGKGNGFGDMELGGVVAPIQIGNRVWNDLDNDGMQDADEPALAGVVVRLVGPGVPANTTVLTGSNGEYYFSSAAGANTTGYLYSLTGLTAGSAYSLVFPTTSGTLTLSSKPDALTGTNADLIDTDANSAGVVGFTLGQAGQNNFSYDAGYTSPVCSISLQSTVSGCYSVSSTSRATVSVEVAWKNAPTNRIVVTSGTQSRTIATGVQSITYSDGAVGSTTVVSPQVVAFEVDLSAANASTVSAGFNPTCVAIDAFTLPTPCPPTACTTGETGGTVFNDYSADGVKNSGETTGVPAVTVVAIACDGTRYTTTTDGFGRYVFSGANLIPADKYPVRIEFTGLPAFAGQGTSNGADGRTTVQFVNAANCTVDLGVLDNTDYCQTNPKVIVPCYTGGDPANSAVSNDDVLVMFDYALSGLKQAAAMTQLATAIQVGSVWGVDYNRNTRQVFTGAVLRRHSGLGPKGLGGIYVINPFSTAPNKVVASWDVEADLGVPVGSSLVPSNTDRALGGNGNSTDPEAWSLTGKVGLGDIDLSEDGNSLYFVNLYDKKLYRTDLTAFNSNTANLPTSATGVSIPNPGCTGGQLRPWGLKVYKGKVYVGAVCDAQDSQNRSNLRAFVYEFDPANGQFASAPVFDFPLTYPKGFPWQGNRNVSVWYAWTDDFPLKWTATYSTSRFLMRPEPMLTDIEFDIDGSMVLGFGDRTGFQTGAANSDLTPPVGTEYFGTSGGDMLRAYKSGNSYILENNAKAGPHVGFGANNWQGPGFGEFYNDDLYGNGFGVGVLDHAEVFQGGLALRPGSGEVVSNAMDAVEGQGNANKNSGGVRYVNNTTGAYVKAYQVYSPGASVMKATGLGDLSLRCDVPTYLQVGNRVWLDDGDGEQDACEIPLAGVNVSLYQNGSLITTTQTDANGEYYFTYSPTSSTVPGSTTALLPNTAYQIVFGTGGQFANNALTHSGNAYQLTIDNATGGNLNDQNDSDAQLATVGGLTAPTISVTTGPAGSVNHTFDAGFIVKPVIASLGNFVWEDTDGNGQQDAGEPSIEGVTVTLIQNGSAVATTTTSVSGLYSFTGLTPGIPYSVSFTTPANFTATTANTGNDASDSDPVGGVTAPVTLTAGENNPTLDAGFVPLFNLKLTKSVLSSGPYLPGSLVTYQLTVTNNSIRPAYNVELTDQLPASLSFVGGTGFTATGTNAVSALIAGPIAASGGTTSLTLTAQVNNSVSSGSSVANGATITRFTSTTDRNGTPGFDTDPSDNSGTTSFTVTLAPTPQLVLTKQVDKSKAELGDTVSYTITLTNTGPVAATSVVVSDTFSAGLSLVAGSSVASSGTFTPGASGGTWTLASLPANATATLVFAARPTEEGIAYNTASIPGQQVQVCTTVPFRVCKGVDYSLEIDVPTGYTTYTWHRFLNGTDQIVGTTRSLTIVGPGEYRVVINAGSSLTGLCPTASCCPIIVIEEELPTITVVPQAPTCVGTTPQANGSFGVSVSATSGTALAGYTYQYSRGSTFNSATASGTLTIGTSATGLVGGQTYTVRVTNAFGCTRDQTFVVPVANCACPVEVCMPVVIKKTKSKGVLVP